MRKNIFSLPILLFLCLFSSSVYAQTPKDLSNVTVTVDPSIYEFDGSPKEPKVKNFMLNRRPVTPTPVEGEDYDLSYENNLHAGTATVTINFKGTRYSGTKSMTFTINPADLDKQVTLELEKYEYNYDGTAKEPAASDLYYGNVKLISGTDYDLRYNKNTNPGTATAEATFKGDYKGSATKDFKIIDSGTVPPSSLMVNYYDRNQEIPNMETEMTYPEFLTLLETFKNAVAIAPQGFDKWPLDKKHIIVEGKSENDNTCNSFTLTDKEDFYSSVSFTANSFKYTRKLVEGNNTVCLPVEIGEADLPENSGLYEFFTTDDENNQIYFVEVQSVSTGYPCLLKTSEACEWTIELNDARIEKTPTGMAGWDDGIFFGTYVLTSAFKYSENTPFYGLRNSDNMFAPLANTLSPFRACIMTHYVNDSEAKAFRVSTFDSITEVEDVKAQNKKTQLNRKFVKDGKIVIAKNGKTYNISGAEIK